MTDTTHDDLVKRLRYLGDHASFEPHMHHTAADRIEELEAQIKDANAIIAIKRTEVLALMIKLVEAVEWAEKVRNYAITWDDKFLAERSNEIIAELTGGQEKTPPAETDGA